MGLKVGVTLISKKTGEKHYFESILHATCFLNRSNCYMKNAQLTNSKITHADTKEEFIMVRDVPYVHGKKVDTINQAKMMDKSICNGCARASGFCSWSATLTPVEGWDADDSFDPDGNWYSYCVKDCPKFIHDAPTAKERRKQWNKLMEEFLNGTEPNPI